MKCKTKPFDGAEGQHLDEPEVGGAAEESDRASSVSVRFRCSTRARTSLDLILVKLGSSSKSGSHLCKQAEVTAELLLGNDGYFRRSVCAEAGLDEGDVQAQRVRLVVAAASDKPGDLAEDLFLFSRISARGARRLIERNLGFRFGLITIAYRR